MGMALREARGTLACVLIARRRRARRCYLACCIGPAPVSAGSAVVDGGSSRRCSTRLALVTKSFKLERSGMFEVCMALRIASRALARVLVARRRRARRCCLASGVRPAPVSASIAVVLGRSSRRRNTWTAGGHSTRRSRGRHCWRRRRFAFVAQSVELQRGRMIEVGLQLFVA